MNEENIRKLLFEQVGGRRYTQDTPIMPDVWLAFARRPTEPLDLILTPTRTSLTGQVAPPGRHGQ